MREWIKTKSDERAVAEGCYFDLEAASKVRTFFEKFCRHSKGQFADKPFELLPWQWQDVIAPMFGWKRADGLRRYNRAGVWVPKKAGKSTLMSGLSLFMLVADGEPGAEVYTIATDREQASIIYNESANMVEASPSLKRRLWVRRNIAKIEYRKAKSFYRVLSGEKKGKHGYNSHCLIWDELAEQKDRELWDILRYSTAFRKQPLLISISTSGFDKESLGWEQYAYADQVLKGDIIDTGFLPVIYAAPEDADWKSLETAKACNPSFNVTVPESDFLEAIQEAVNEPRKEAAYKTLRLNRWVGHASQWLSTTAWEACGEPFDLKQLEGKDCYVGMDLARKHDLAAYVLWFTVEDLHYLLPRFFMPKDWALLKQKKDRVSYLHWEREGLITLTPGDVIDYKAIRKQLNEDAKRYNILQIGYDPYNAEPLSQDLRFEDGLRVVEVRQSLGTMGLPTGQFEKLINEKKIRHGNHPILNWNAQNCVVRIVKDDYIMIDKSAATNRIDGIVASIIALSRQLAAYRGAQFMSDFGAQSL